LFPLGLGFFQGGVWVWRMGGLVWTGATVLLRGDSVQERPAREFNVPGAYSA